MFNLRDISIRNKLVLMQVFTSVIVLGVFFVVFILSDIESYKKRKAESVMSLAHVIAKNSISAIQFRDNETAAAILSDLKDISPEVVYAVIIDKNGKHFAGYSRPGTDSLAIPDFKNNQNKNFIGNYLFVTENIETENELLGKVSLQVELSELDKIKKDRYSLVAFLLIGATAFSFLIAFLVQAYISRRLLYLVNTMKQVSNTGEYITVKDEGKDEISTLVHAFNSLMIEVKESQQKKDEFIGIASHELKTPLTSIKGYLDLLNTLERDQTNKLFVQKSIDSVHKLERLIKDLLDVSKIQSGQLQLNMKEFNIDELVTEVIHSLQPLSASHKILRQSNFDGETLYADRQRIEQVLINILSNAIKYSPGENEIVINCIKNDGMLMIQVRDYGIGIAEEESDHVFERFYRVKDAATNISGFGLGLYICRDIITRHNGKIWIQKETKGSSFFIALPNQHHLKSV